MVLKGVYLFILMAGLLHNVLAVTYTCDPFYKLIQEGQKTCLSSNIGYNASQDFLTVYSSFSGCENQNESESASIFFSDRYSYWTVQIEPNYDFYFEYTIMWTSTESNCVVDLSPAGTSTNSSDLAVSWAMVDQNGISNNPLENLTDFALNKPYTRRFIISPGSPTVYRFGFTCANPNGEISSSTEQTAIISRIMYGMVDETAHWDRAIFYPGWIGFGCTTNTSCPDPPPNDDAICVVDRSWGDTVWFYNGNYYASTFRSSPVFDGDFYVDEGQWTDSYVRGCIYPWRVSTVKIVLFPDWSMRLRFGQGKQCDMFPFTIVGSLPPGFAPNCNYTLDPSKVQISYEGSNYMIFVAPLSVRNQSGCTPTSPNTNDGTTYSDENSGLWVFVFCLVGAGLLLIGGVLGIVFGVRRYRQRQQKKDEKKQVPADAAEEKPSERR